MDGTSKITSPRRAKRIRRIFLNSIWETFGGTGHFTALSGKTLSEEKDDIEIWNV